MSEKGRLTASLRLPDILRPLFWDYHFGRLTQDRDRDLIVSRVLVSGTWDHIRWLRDRYGDEVIREWLVRRAGGGLSRPQLRFWELLLELPRKQVDAWMASPGRTVWDKRVRSE